ncbi:MAG: hypothetical protein RL365_2234 [Bacteroidota bacterium]|jgi:hypothetical protein
MIFALRTLFKNVSVLGEAYQRNTKIVNSTVAVNSRVSKKSSIPKLKENNI